MSSPGETIKNMFLAGFGMFALTRDRIGDVVEDLVQSGDMRAGDAEAMVTELTERANTERAIISELVSEQFSLIATDMGIVTRKDLKTVTQRIERIEKILK